ncbi:MAG: hypothetical protein M9932_17795 [Xanthobacteraceae bacterium]|nr:hypothetical protein [Xanthobacteraceae bacterium]
MDAFSQKPLDVAPAVAEELTFIDVDKALIESILNTIQNIELEVQYLRLKALFEEPAREEPVEK